MGKQKRLQLGDLVDLKGLKTPEEGVVTVELGGADVKPESVKQFRNKISGLAEQLENNQNVPVGEVTSLVAAINNALKRELSPERASKLLVILKKRFLNESFFSHFREARHYRKAEGIKWEDVQAKLEKNPTKLWSLNEMETTGGEPDVTGCDPQTGEYIFMDCSEESPKGRRSCVYDRAGEEELKKDFRLRSNMPKYKSNAVVMAALMGVSLLTESEYLELQTKGEFDKQSFTWLDTPSEIRKRDMALHGHRDVSVRIVSNMVSRPDKDRGFRTSLRV